MEMIAQENGKIKIKNLRTIWRRGSTSLFWIQFALIIDLILGSLIFFLCLLSLSLCLFLYFYRWELGMRFDIN